MSQMCKICLMPAPTRKRVDAELYLGTSYKKIAVRFSTKKMSISHQSVFRHRQHLIPQEVRRTPPPSDPQAATTVLERVEQLIAEFRSIADATKVQQPPWAIAAMKEILRGLEMIGKITGEISPANINFNALNFQLLTEEQVVTFLDGVRRRGDPALRRALEQRFPSSTLPAVVVNFVEAAPPLLEASPANGNGSRVY
jgi:hypothetical protein